jgi:gliding motility-associated-like protein
MLLSIFGGKIFCQPIANFSANTISGCAPFTVRFQDNSTGNPSTWRWDLGNGAISGLQSPSTTYFTPGSYTISLTVTNANGSSILTRTGFIKVYDRPVVNFTAGATEGCLPFTTNFTDLSTSSFGTINRWEWDFNDGDTSLLQNPIHTFTVANNYAITLKVTNNNGCATVISKPQFVKAADAARAAFTFSPPTNCKPPETISFINTSTGPGSMSYNWNFGDSSMASAPNPAHTYLAGGNYTVQLIAVSSYGCADTILQTNAFVIKNTVATIAGPDSICAGAAANFTNNSVPAPLSAAWNFGDGSTAVINNPVKKWNSAGTFSVKLINDYGTCKDSVIKSVTVLPLPIAKFYTADTAGCSAPLTVNFINLSTGAVSWLWNFGDGNSSSVSSPAHTYTNAGIFSVHLTATTSYGCKVSDTIANYIKIIKPTITLNNLPYEGCLPLTINPTATVFSADGVAAYQWDFGNGFSSNTQNPSTNYTLPGNYTIKLLVTTNKGCTDSAIAVNGVHTGTSPIIDFTALPLSQCASLGFQFTNLSLPTDKWEWHFGDGSTSTLQNPLHVYDDTGKFTIKLVAWNNGCKDSLTKINYVNTLPPVARFLPIYDCSNRQQISFIDTSILPQTWLWNFGDGATSTDPNPVHIFPQLQTYSVSLTVTNGSCTSTATLPVHLIQEIPFFTASKNFLCKNDSVLLTATNINSANVAAYQWYFGDGTMQTTNVPAVFHKYITAGTYSIKLKIKDLNGCQDSITINNIIHIYGPKAGFTATPITGCVPTVVSFTDTSNTDGINNLAKWEWTYGDGQTQIFSGTIPIPVNHIYTTPGRFAPMLTVTDSIGCIDSIKYAIPLFITKPVASFSSDNNNTCVGNTITFYDFSSGANLQYLWNFGDGTTSTNSNPTKQYSANGNYTVKLIVTDTNGCRDSLVRPAYAKVQDTYASFTMSDSVSSCTPFQVRFTNTSQFSVSQKWDFGDGSTSTLANPVYYYSAPGRYTVRLKSIRSAFCTSTVSKQINVYPTTARLSYTPLDGCSPLNVSFHITTAGQVSYLWDFNDGNTVVTADSFYTHSYTLPGVFIPKIILKDSIGCQIPITGTDTIRLYSSKVNFGVADSLFCDSATVAFIDSTVSGSAVANYTWSFGDGFVSNLQNPIHQFAAPGLYSIGLHISTIYGCNDSASKPNYIKIVRTPKALINGDSIVCGPSAIALSGLLQQPDTSIIKWHWLFNSTTTYLQQNPPVLQYNTPGTYPVQLIVTNSSGCADTVNRRITIYPLPTTTAGKDTSICLGGAATLLASGADTYNWSPASFLSCTVCSSPVAPLRNSTLLYVTGKNIFGCAITDSVFVTVKKPFQLLATPAADSICINQSVQLLVSGTEKYAWLPAAGLSNISINNPIASPKINTVYTVVGFDSSYCFYDTILIPISVFPYPTVNVMADKIINIGTATTLTAQYSNDAVEWLWSPPASLDCSACPQPIATPTANTTYTVVVKNKGGCTATDAVKITVACDDSNLFLPTAFTPNGNTTNEVFYPSGVGIFRIVSLQIFNRWGELVFQKFNFLPNDKSAGWDGYYKGKIVPVGNYVYTIDIICSNNILLSRKGNILLLR